MDLFILNPRDILICKHPWNEVNPVFVLLKVKGKNYFESALIKTFTTKISH